MILFLYLLRLYTLLTAALQCFHEALLNTSEVFAKANEARNSYCLKFGKLLKLNVSQEIFIKNSGEQYYQLIF